MSDPQFSMSGPTDPSQPTHYQILRLTQSDCSLDPAQLKVAYRRALLLHHPDKRCSSSSRLLKSVAQTPNHAYSVDQITEAYSILSNAFDKARYDTSLQGNTKRLNTVTKTGHHAGVETYDLDELAQNDDMGTWSRECRCGDSTGYRLTTSDLEEESEHGEVFVGCKGCSLFIRVLFESAQTGTDMEDVSRATKYISGDYYR